jgi:hypothetical protein
VKRTNSLAILFNLTRMLVLFFLAIASACVITAQDNYAWVCPGDTRAFSAQYFLLAPGVGDTWVRANAANNPITFARNGASSNSYTGIFVSEKGSAIAFISIKPCRRHRLFK